jgi:hypothetical protein
MTVYQYGRTKDSVTICVEGITEGARRTTVYIPYAPLNENGDRFYALDDAKLKGYINDFDTVSIDGVANGYITVTVTKEYLDYDIKCLQFKVENIETSYGDSWVILSAIFEFQYQNAKSKSEDTEIDITVKDMQEINLFGLYIKSWIAGGEAYYYPLEDVFSGDYIFAEYLNLPAQNMLTSIDYIITNGFGYANAKILQSFADDIAKNCVSGSDFAAYYFNNIASIINNLNLAIEV